MPARTGVARLRFAASLLAGAAALGLIGCSPAVTASPTAAPTPTFTSPPTIAPSGPPTIEPIASATTATSAPACTADDLKASHGPVEGAAGSRLTTVVLVAQVGCSIDAYPAVGLRDANGAVLVGGVAGGPGRIDLDPNGSYESAVRFGNWCGTDPAFPLTIDLRIGGGEVAVTGSSFPDEGDMPPCTGGGGPVLEAGAWAPSA
jgi:uncharacterized protein DUF4232